MSTKNAFWAIPAEFHARRTGFAGIKPCAKRAAKKFMSRASRVDGKTEVQLELNALANAPLHEALLDRSDLARACYTSQELEAMADMLLSVDEPLDLEGADEDTLDLGAVKGLPLELIGSLPDWMLDKLDAANGDVFDYLALLETRARRTTAGMLAEELEAA